MKQSVDRLQKLAVAFWYGIALLVALEYLRTEIVGDYPTASNRSFEAWVGFAQSVLGLVLLVAFFVLIHLALQAAFTGLGATGTPPPASAGEFPSPETVLVGVWLLIANAACVIALFMALSNPAWLTEVVGPKHSVVEAFIMMFAAGIGSNVSTILAYLQHASGDRDFHRRWIPWYVGRPLMGILLGLIFYFVLKGGLWAMTPSGQITDELNSLSLAAFGALVGLFSKNAIEKLREIFNSLFRTQQESNQELLNRLPEALKNQVEPYMANATPNKPKPGDQGDGDDEGEGNGDDEGDENGDDEGDENGGDGNGDGS
jgi:hypothetical protein